MAVTASQVQRAQPRISELDALRGFALLGILLVNALMMAGPYALGGIDDPDASLVDRTVEGVVQTFVVGKFYLMFSFLFGYSFSLQLTSADRDGERPVPRLLRRSLGLFALGALHAVLLFSGDILMTYAVLGLILIAVRGCSPQAALLAAKIVYGCVGGLLLLVGLASLFLSDAEAADLDAELAVGFPDLIAGYRGDAAAVVRANLDQLPEALLAVPVMGGLVVAAFLVGLRCGKVHFLGDRADHGARLRRVCLLGVAAGLPGSVFMALATSGPLGPRWAVLGQMVGTVTAPALTAAYVCGMLLFMRTARGARVMAVLAPAGRMALTNYLSQSLVMALVFTGYGLARYGRLGPAVVVLGALVLYGAQLALSARLMARFRYGPVEWLLRTVTLARLPGAPAGDRGRADDAH
ncbi:DUF418 domain-containing protein [Streptomyces antarcticus]|uniref:DUF418 domain-containing protein n=1 Tax=Streptomyces antarcticus TaxID=2996458 RepID=UPI0022718EF1|nr:MULTISPECIES: DUF418 domain-containing protein [unclassified Streptomyces]MCY0943058.1 DUF418 domain-containing protein [Streptomyces sp. H34-AA3]MCZ4084419.1 DUF418 domain-containing protein [Streptomyces sp. H34-S5]